MQVADKIVCYNRIMTKITQLTTIFLPTHYDLHIKLERLTRKFHGTVTIHGTHVDAKKPVALHAKGLNIRKALINTIPSDIALCENDEVRLTPASALSTQELEIVIEFEGTITDAPHGLYVSHYEHNGEKKELLATQLEPHHAREIFPCIDEPAAKATFDLTLDTETDIDTLSNMPITTQTKTSDMRLVTTFDTTPKMSTYLLAFVVGELQCVKAKSKSGIDVRIWSTLTQPKASLTYALEAAVKTIDFFEDYFGYAYPLPKADHIALPDMGGGAAAAMENWGLITYREDYLACDENTGISTKQRIARVVIHETSHQWFGNLVTMKWWDDLWLNESFASLMEYIGLEALFPEWHYWEQFPLSETMPALRRDSNQGVQSVKTEVHHPDEIGTIFDGAIVYAKGATVLNMTRVHVGDLAFQQGLKKYFETHAYGNTTGDDLWNSLGETVADFITPWLTQSGYPVVDIIKEKDFYTLKQSQFLVGSQTQSKKIWPIPLYSNQPSIPDVLSDRSLRLSAHEPLQLNIGGHGQYVTNYDSENRQYLIDAITHNKLSVVDRLRILLDTTLLMKTDHLPTHELIDLLRAFTHETSQPVWEIMSYAIGDLKKIIENDLQAEQNLKKLIMTLTRKQYKSLGWDESKDETAATKKLRGDIIGLSLYAEHPDVITHALHLYDAHKNNLTKINGELRALVLIAAVRHAPHNKEVIEHLLSLHDRTNNSELQEDIITGLCGTNDSEVLQRLLEIMKDSSRVRPQNAVHWYIYCLRNKHGKTLAWEWIQNNWKWVKQTYGSDKSYDIFPRALGTTLSTPQELKEYSRFFKKFEHEPSLARTIEVAKGEISARVEWITQDHAEVLKKLHQL